MNGDFFLIALGGAGVAIISLAFKGIGKLSPKKAWTIWVIGMCLWTLFSTLWFIDK